MHQVSIRGELMSIPNVCCCCCSPKAKQRYRVSASRVGRWIDTSYRDRRWTHFLICKKCNRWVRANQSASFWFPQFIPAMGLGILAGVAAVLATLQTTTGMVWGVLAVTLFLYGCVAVALWLFQQSKARQLDPGPPCHPRPVVLVDWLRNKHTFEFSNEDYFNLFRTLNRNALC